VGELGAVEIGGDLFFDAEPVAFAEIVLEQHVFGRDGAVRLELEHPMAVRLLLRDERLGGARDRVIERGGRGGGGAGGVGVGPGRGRVWLRPGRGRARQPPSARAGLRGRRRGGNPGSFRSYATSS